MSWWTSGSPWPCSCCGPGGPNWLGEGEIYLTRNLQWTKLQLDLSVTIASFNVPSNPTTLTVMHCGTSCRNWTKLLQGFWLEFDLLPVGPVFCLHPFCVPQQVLEPLLWHDGPQEWTFCSSQVHQLDHEAKDGAVKHGGLFAPHDEIIVVQNSRNVVEHLKAKLSYRGPGMKTMFFFVCLFGANVKQPYLSCLPMPWVWALPPILLAIRGSKTLFSLMTKSGMQAP